MLAIQKTIDGGEAIWLPVDECHKGALALMDRHYSRKTIGANRMGGPGEKLILITPNNDAVFGWRKTVFRLDNQKGIECFIFRNEGNILSSFLIREAERLAWQKWPGVRLFTFVNGGKIRSTNPGHCFLVAGWKKCGKSKGGLIVLDRQEF